MPTPTMPKPRVGGDEVAAMGETGRDAAYQQDRQPAPMTSIERGLFARARRIVRAERRDDFRKQLGGVDGAVVAVGDLAPWRDEHRVRERAGPLGVEGLDERVGAGLGVEIIRRVAAFGFKDALEPAGRHGVMFPQNFSHLRLQLGIVEAEKNELEVAVAEPARERDELGKLGDAWRAPGGPDVDQAEPVRVVLRELSDTNRLRLI